jgi:DNA-binding transcriptional MerR regulator
MAGVSVRTLHHYDRIGLLHPSERSQAGYRLYGERDLLRLQQILFYRELDVPLGRIREILDGESFDLLRALTEHRALLEARGRRIASLIDTIDRTTARLRGEVTMRSDEELYEGFPKEKVDEWKAEAEARWGDAYVESDRRVRSWSKEKLAAVRAEGEGITSELSGLMDRGPLDPSVQALAGRFYEHLRHYYEPSPEVFAGLGRMYVDHPDFRARFEALRPGLAAFLRDAMAAYAEGLRKPARRAGKGKGAGR